ncbi:MAG: hypothetical protein JXB23_00690 [Candidatus Aminicenantes bacterium]|nr:hypothetical protein [Candidatus Aminicenantes bacterium]
MNRTKVEKGLEGLKGIILPARWDSGGNVVAISISTHGEEEYLICNDSKGMALFGYLHELVQVTGRFKDIRGVKCIVIKEVERCPVALSFPSNASPELNRHS